MTYSEAIEFGKNEKYDLFNGKKIRYKERIYEIINNLPLPTDGTQINLFFQRFDGTNYQQAISNFLRCDLEVNFLVRDLVDNSKIFLRKGDFEFI